MKDEDRSLDKVYNIYPVKGRNPVTKDVIKSAFIAEGLSLKEISDRYNLPLERLKDLSKLEKWTSLRKKYVSQGLGNLQQKQLSQAQSVLDIERNFKALRIAQLEEMLKDFAAYLARHGDLKKRCPDTGEILKDSNGMDIMIKLPNVTKEISDLRESISTSSGLQLLLNQLQNIPEDGEEDKSEEDESLNKDTIDVSDYKYLFSKNEEK